MLQIRVGYFGRIKTHQNFCQGNRLKDISKQLGGQQQEHFLDAQAPEKIREKIYLMSSKNKNFFHALKKK